MILSASELALLPLEMARSAPGMPGSGQHLSLQDETPVVMTREIRRVPDKRLAWPDRPRILFIASSAAGKVPLDAHSLALRQLIEPWMRYEAGPGGRAQVEQHLTILPQADVRQITEMLRKGSYTHVHILAHGVPFEYAGDERYGIALHDPKDPAKSDIIEGSRLASLLHTCRPAVVTLATCQGAAGGSVVGPGGSVAHALHQAGVPLVVASQFPLTFTASVVMVQVLYEGLLYGQDPRVLVQKLRYALKAQVSGFHDWASLVAYAALPEDLDRQLFGVQLGRLRQQVNAAMSMADQALYSGEPLPAQVDFGERMAAVRKRLLEMAAEDGTQREELFGLLASLEKREAQVRIGWKEPIGGIEKILRRSRNYYWEAYKANHSSSWALVQYLVLDSLLSRRRKTRFRHDQWAAARFLAERDLRSSRADVRTWALGSLIELHLLALLEEPSSLIPVPATVRERASRYARELNESGVVREIYTTRYQIFRYRDMFHRWFRSDPLKKLASDLIPILSKGISFEE
jgi:hypothetical protein